MNRRWRRIWGEDLLCDARMDTRIWRSKGIHGTVNVPGDKSISHRSLIISALAEGVSEIQGLLSAADPRSTLSCLRQLGAESDWNGPVLRVKGCKLHGLSRPEGVLDAGNSGTTMRLLAGVLAGQRFTSQITGDDSLRKRPMRRIIEPLSHGSAFRGHTTLTAPFTVHGVFPLRAIDYQMPIASAQVKSAVLLAGLFADGTTRVSERTQTRDHTERMLNLQAKKSSTGTTVEVVGGTKIPAQIFQIPWRYLLSGVSHRCCSSCPELRASHPERRVESNTNTDPGDTAIGWWFYRCP